MATVTRFSLTQLFGFTTIVALFAFGAGIGQADAQTGFMVALFAAALLLVHVFLRMAAVFWIGLATGFALSAASYWWNDFYNEVHPADRLFEFVARAIWWSVIAAVAIPAAWIPFQRSRQAFDGRAKNSDGST